MMPRARELSAEFLLPDNGHASCPPCSSGRAEIADRVRETGDCDGGYNFVFYGVEGRYSISQKKGGEEGRRTKGTHVA